MSVTFRDVVLGFVHLFAGCGGTKEVTQDAAPPKEEGPKCECIEQDKPHSMVNQDAFDAMYVLWNGQVKKAQAENWHLDARIHFGAMPRVFGQACIDPAKVDAKTKEYQDAIKIFFETHYAERAKDAENGVLVLIGGIAPEAVKEDSFTAAIKAMSTADVTQKDFGQVLSACYHYNRATEKAADRFTDKASGARLSENDKAVARDEIARAEELIAPYLKMIADGKWEALNEALTDHQQKILIELGDAIAAYKRTLGKGPRAKTTPPVSTRTAPPATTPTTPPVATPPPANTGGKTIPNPF